MRRTRLYPGDVREQCHLRVGIGCIGVYVSDRHNSIGADLLQHPEVLERKPEVHVDRLVALGLDRQDRQYPRTEVTARSRD